MELLDRLGLEHPVVQAGMGGGIAGSEQPGAVSRAGGLGTVGIRGPGAMRDELRGARERAGDGRPGRAARGMPDRLVEVTPLYAGECVRDVREVVRAADAVRELAGAGAVPSGR